MPRIFISYSHSDRVFVDNFVPLLRRVYGQVWFDDRLRGGQLWWKEILSQISACDIFIYLLSRKSLSSKNCLAEFDEARRLHKPILPIRLEPGLKIPPEVSQYQYVDLSKGILPDSLSKLYGAIQFLSETTSPTYPSVFQPTAATLPVPPSKHHRPSRRLILTIVTVLAIALSTVGFLLATGDDNTVADQPSTRTAAPNANVQLRYTLESLTLENIGAEHIDISQLIFEGDESGRFVATGWSEDSPISAILRHFRPGGCVHLVLSPGAVPEGCRYYGYWSWRSNDYYHFWIENTGNTQFTIQNGDAVVATCPVVTTSDEAICEFNLP